MGHGLRLQPMTSSTFPAASLITSPPLPTRGLFTIRQETPGRPSKIRTTRSTAAAARAVCTKSGIIRWIQPVNSAEVYPGLTSCGVAVDVPWISENPTTGTLPLTRSVEAKQASTLHLMRRSGSTGDYKAHVKIQTSYTVPNVNAIMHVPLPTGWGYLDEQ